MNKKYSILTAMALVAILLVNPLTISAASDMINGNDTDREVMTERHNNNNHMNDEDFENHEDHMNDENHMNGRNHMNGNDHMTDNESGHHRSMRGSRRGDNRNDCCNREGRFENNRNSSRK